MENNEIDATSQKGLVDELVEGRDLTKQLYSILLKESLSSSSSSTNNEAPSLNVTQQILSKIERSLALLRYEPSAQMQCITMGTIDSPLSFNGTPKSPDDLSEGDFKDQSDSKEDSRKRKIVPRCTIKVEGCCKSGLEGPIDDGFSWRKYGQKDILGATYPRAYYRCTQRTQGCFATKQVQRSDIDPTYFEVTYRGKHTCYQSSSSSRPEPKPEPSNNVVLPNPHPQEVLWSFETDDSKDIKPKVTGSIINTQIKSSSFPPRFSSDYYLDVAAQRSSSHIPHDSALLSPRIRNNSNFIDYQQNNINPQDGNSSLANSINNNNNNTNNSLDNIIASQFFDQGELDDHDFIFNNAHLFRQ